jgi:hypothetical protein
MLPLRYISMNFPLTVPLREREDMRSLPPSKMFLILQVKICNHNSIAAYPAAVIYFFINVLDQVGRTEPRLGTGASAGGMLRSAREGHKGISPTLPHIPGYASVR